MTKSALPFARLTRTTALALALVTSGLAGVAYADDEYGTSHETVIRQAATSAGSNVLSTVASSAPIMSTGFDVAGGGGPQDALARQIFHPGSGTDW